MRPTQTDGTTRASVIDDLPVLYKLDMTPGDEFGRSFEHGLHEGTEVARSSDTTCRLRRTDRFLIAALLEELEDGDRSALGLANAASGRL